MWQRLANSLGMEEDGGGRGRASGVELTSVLVDFAERRRRLEVARRDGSMQKYLLRLAVMADLMRIRGVGVQYAELLEKAGFGVAGLRVHRADAVTRCLARVNRERRITRRAPSAVEVASWIQQAKVLEPVVQI